MRSSSILNPGLPAYPNFVAGEAVRSQLSPDGTTLAILTAGQNSLYKPDGTVDVAELDAVHLSLRRGGRQQGQAGAHAGDPAGERPRRPGLLAGRQHALRRRRQRRRGLRLHEERRRLHGRRADCARPFRTRRDRQRAQQGRRPQRAAQRQRHGHLRRRRDAGRRQQLQRLDQRDRYRHTPRPLRARPASVLREQRGPQRRRRRHLPVRGRREGQRHGVRVVGSRSRGRGGRRVVPHRGAPDQAHQARRQRARHDARRLAVEALRGAGQRRPGRGHRHVDQPGHGQDRRAGSGRHAARTEVHRRGHLRGDAVARRQHALRRQQRRELDRRDPADGPPREHGQRPDPDRLRAARHHVQRRRLLDVHRQRQERHRAEPRPPRRQHRQHHQHHLPGRQCRGRGRLASVEPVSVPAGARVAGQRSGAGSDICTS